MNFNGTEYEIWDGFGPVGSTENFGLSCKVHMLVLRAMFSWAFFFFNIVVPKGEGWKSKSLKQRHL